MPEPESEYDRQERWQKDTRRYLCAIWKHWQWWIYTSLGSAVAIIISWRGVVIPAWILVIIALVGLVVATFKVWRCEYYKAKNAGIELDTLKSRPTQPQPPTARRMAEMEIEKERIKKTAFKGPM
jgi:hypothetical protein